MDNLKVVGIVAEYNPFHNGHKYQIEKIKKEINPDFIVAIMSGNFTQRGEPAILDKWTRTEIALNNGVDIVIELPVYYSLNSANNFAYGSIKTLKKFGIITHIAFGSESGNIEELKQVANFLLDETLTFKENVQNNLNKGYSYPKSIDLAFKSEKIFNNFSFTSNNILAIEYLKQIKKQSFNCKAITIKRLGQAHLDNEVIDPKDNLSDIFMSGSTIRKEIKNLIKHYNDNLSKEELKYLSICDKAKEAICKNIDELWLDDWYRIYNLVKYRALCFDRNIWENLSSGGEGIEGKLLNNARKMQIKDIVDDMISKRYTRSRINRLLLQSVLNLSNKEPKEFLRILGFTNKGGELIKKVKRLDKNLAPIFTNVKPKDYEIFKDEIRSTDLYNLILKRDVYKNSDFVKKPVILY